VHIIYIGDYDPAGVLIDRSIEAELRRHLPPEIDLTFHRLAITPEQIAAYDLPTKPRKPGDKRALHVTETVEAEAMPAGILRQLLRDKIESFLPPGALDVIKAAEESEREGLELWAQLMSNMSVSSPATPPPVDSRLSRFVPYFRAIETLAGPDWDNEQLIHHLAEHWPWNPEMILEADLLLWNVRKERERIDGGAP
jgi:hypothetical protein